MDWKDLGQRVNFIRDLYKKNKIAIKPDGGLARALDGASALTAGEKLLSGAATYTRVLAVAQTQTLVEPVGEDGNTVLRRLGNSCFFDDRIGVPDDALVMAKRVAQAFNPKPRVWTEIKDLVQGTSTDADAADSSSQSGDSA